MALLEIPMNFIAFGAVRQSEIAYDEKHEFAIGVFMRTNFRRSRVLLPAAVLLCGALARADAPNPEPEKIELRLRLKQGQTFDQVVAIEQKTAQTINRRQLTTAFTMRFELHNEVLGVRDDGAMRVRLTYRRVQLAAKASPQFPAPERFAVAYDSAHPPQTMPPGAAAVAALAGQSLVATYSPEGKTLKIEGLEQLAERILDFSKVPAKIRDEVRAQIRDTMATQTEKQSSLIAHFPDRTIGIGDQWQSEVAIQAPLSGAFQTKFTLLALGDGTARIGIASQLALSKSDQYSLSGRQSGVLSVDEATGLTQSFELHQNFSGKIQILPPEQKAQSVPISISSTIRGWTIAPPN